MPKSDHHVSGTRTIRSDSPTAAAEGASSQREVGEIIAQFFSRPQSGRSTKQHRLHQAVLDAVLDGQLVPGDQLPPEADLSRLLGVSLGTTQRALGGLTRRGLIERFHGRGTFVSPNHIAQEELWHFRFIDDDKSRHYLPVFATSLKTELTAQTGPWTQVLGVEDQYIEIIRNLDIDGRCRCLSRIYLSANRFGRIVTPEEGELRVSNIKLLVRQLYGVTYTAVDQQVRFTTISPDVAPLIGAEAGHAAIALTIIGYDAAGQTISYHEITIPQCDLAIDLSFNGVPVRFGARMNRTF